MVFIDKIYHSDNLIFRTSFPFEANNVSCNAPREQSSEWHDEEKTNKVYRCTQKYTAIPFDIAIKHSIFLLLSCPVI